MYFVRQHIVLIHVIINDFKDRELKQFSQKGLVKDWTFGVQSPGAPVRPKHLWDQFTYLVEFNFLEVKQTKLEDTTGMELNIYALFSPSCSGA
jgi:hypothetical protein